MKTRGERDLRQRACNPNTGCCQTCGANYEDRRDEECSDRDRRWRAADRPLRVDQIWQGLVAAGFLPTKRTSLAPRIVELVRLEKLERVAFGTYRLSEKAS